MWKLLAGTISLISQVQALRLGTSSPGHEGTDGGKKEVFHVHLAVQKERYSFLQQSDDVRLPKLKELVENWLSSKSCKVFSVGEELIEGFPQLTDCDVSFWCPRVGMQAFVDSVMVMRNQNIGEQEKREGILRMGGSKVFLMHALSSSFVDLHMAILFTANNDPKLNEGNNKEKLQAMLAGLFPETGSEKDMFTIKNVVQEFSEDKTVVQYKVVFKDLTGTLSQLTVYSTLFYNGVAKASAAGGFIVSQIQTMDFDMKNFKNGRDCGNDSIFLGFSR